MSRAAALAVLAAALGLHGLLAVLELWPSPRRLWGDEVMYADLAERAARGEEADPELLWPPLYPRLLGMAARLGPLAAGDVAAARWLVFATQLGGLALAAACLHALALRLTGSGRAAALAAALLALDPQLASFAHYLWPEPLHLALFLLALALLARHPTLPAVAAAGVLLGLALLTRSVLLPFLPVFALALAASRPGRLATRVGAAALLLATSGAVLLPRALGNLERHGTFTVADSSLFNLWVGLNDRSARNLDGDIVGDEYLGWQASAPDFRGRQAVLQEKLLRLLRERSWPELLAEQLARQPLRLLDRRSFLTDQLPGGAIAVRGFGYRQPPGWASALLTAWNHAHHALLLATAPFGIALLLRRREPWLVALLAFLAGNLALLLFLHVKTRYRVPLLPVLELAGGAALAGGWRGQLSARALAAAGSAALALLAVAFALP